MQKITIPPGAGKKPGKPTEQKPKPKEVKDASADSVEDVKEKEVFENKETASEEKEPKILRTEEVDLDSKGPEAQQKTKVNFVDKDFMSGFVKKKTEESKKPEDEKTTSNEGLSAEEIKKKINEEEREAANQFTKEEMQDFAEVFMDILDMLISTGLRHWAKDTSATAYELPEDRKRKIVRQLTNLFIKYQTKFSLEFMFVITLCICYYTPFKKANDRRKGIKSGVVDEKRGKGKPSK